MAITTEQKELWVLQIVKQNMQNFEWIMFEKHWKNLIDTGVTVFSLIFMRNAEKIIAYQYRNNWFFFTSTLIAFFVSISNLSFFPLSQLFKMNASRVMLVNVVQVSVFFAIEISINSNKCLRYLLHLYFLEEIFKCVWYAKWGKNMLIIREHKDCFGWYILFVTCIV